MKFHFLRLINCFYKVKIINLLYSLQNKKLESEDFDKKIIIIIIAKLLMLGYPF
jgi:hypothetical protein